MSQVTPILLHLAEILVMVLNQNVKMFVLDGIYNIELNLEFSKVHLTGCRSTLHGFAYLNGELNQKLLKA